MVRPRAFGPDRVVFSGGADLRGEAPPRPGDPHGF